MKVQEITKLGSLMVTARESEQGPVTLDKWMYIHLYME